jgi:hypothetical protein
LTNQGFTNSAVWRLSVRNVYIIYPMRSLPEREHVGPGGALASAGVRSEDPTAQVQPRSCGHDVPRWAKNGDPLSPGFLCASRVRIEVVGEIPTGAGGHARRVVDHEQDIHRANRRLRQAEGEPAIGAHGDAWRLRASISGAPLIQREITRLLAPRPPAWGTRASAGPSGGG